MNKVYLAHSGGYDSTLCLYELCDKHVLKGIEIFPIYVRVVNRPHQFEILAGQTSIKECRKEYENSNNIIIHDLVVVDSVIGNIEHGNINDSNFRFEQGHQYYSSFLINIAYLCNVQDVNTIVFGFNAEDGIQAKLREFEDAVESIRKLAYIDHYHCDMQKYTPLYFLYPLRFSDKKKVIKILHERQLLNKSMFFACEGREKQETWDVLPTPCGWCEKCLKIQPLLKSVCTPPVIKEPVLTKADVKRFEVKEVRK